MYSCNYAKESTNEREIKLSRYGRIYKRKSPGKLGYKCKQTSMPGHRYCKKCDALLPLEAFYKKPLRYICRRHHYLRVQQKREHQFEQNIFFNQSKIAWYQLLDDISIFGYDKIRYDRRDLQDILTHLNLPCKIYPSIIPIDPLKPLRPRNLAIVSNYAYNLAKKMYHYTPCRSAYIMFVQKSNLVPPISMLDIL